MEINENEKETLDQFRDNVIQLKVFGDEAIPANHFLVRWLRARNQDVSKAIEMLQKYVEWRRTNENLQMVVSRTWTPPQIITDDLKFKFTGMDHAGRPILWMPIARYDVKGLLEAGLKEDCFRQCYLILEEIMDTIEKQRLATGATQFVGIIDSAELTLRKITHIETIQAMLHFFREFEAYYPELLHSCYIVNAPWIFSNVFTLVRPLLSKYTIEKINIFDSNEGKWKPILMQKLPAEALPEEYGGTGEPVLTSYNKNNN